MILGLRTNALVGNFPSSSIASCTTVSGCYRRSGTLLHGNGAGTVVPNSNATQYGARG